MNWFPILFSMIGLLVLLAVFSLWHSGVIFYSEDIEEVLQNKSNQTARQQVVDLLKKGMKIKMYSATGHSYELRKLQSVYFTPFRNMPTAEQAVELVESRINVAAYVVVKKTIRIF